MNERLGESRRLDRDPDPLLESLPTSDRPLAEDDRPADRPTEGPDLPRREPTGSVHRPGGLAPVRPIASPPKGAFTAAPKGTSISVDLDAGTFLTLLREPAALIDSSGKAIAVNGPWVDLVGGSAESWLGRRLDGWLHSADRQAWQSSLVRLAGGASSVELEARCRDAGGTYRWLGWRMARDARRGCVAVIAKELVDRSVDRGALYQVLLESLPDCGLMLLNERGDITDWSDGAERLYGYPEREIVGRSVGHFYVHEEVRAAKPEMELRLAANNGWFHDEGFNQRQDGSIFWAEVTVAALLDADGQSRGFARLVRDRSERRNAETALRQAYSSLEERVSLRTAELVSTNASLHQEIQERKQMEAKLRRSREHLRKQAHTLKATIADLQNTQAKLVQAEKMSGLGQLVAGVAHEINNPVTFIYGNTIHASRAVEDLLLLVEAYRHTYPNPEPALAALLHEVDLDFLKSDLPQLLASLRSGSDRIHKIVQSLRNFARLDESDRKMADVHQGLDNALLLLRHSLGRKPNRPQIEVKCRYDALPPIECYPGALNQVFLNLLANAIEAFDDLPPVHFATHSPQLRVTTHVFEDWIEITIADNGPGMDAETAHRAFEPFFTTKPVGSGTGLGLAIAYQIVAGQHGGRIDCRTQPGRGCEISIALPIWQVR